MLISRLKSAWRRRSLPTNLQGLQSLKASYSQFGEDVAVSCYLRHQKERGFYVDVGCFHPTKWSNTYRYYLQGWNGICVDPNKSYARLWQKYRPRDIFIAVGVWDIPGDGCYERSENGSAENYVLRLDQVGEGLADDPERIELYRLEDLIATYYPDGKTIDLMTIDCEHHDLRVLRSNNFEKYRPYVLIVEDHGRMAETDIDRFCQYQGYKLVGVCNVSKIYKDARTVAAP